MCDSDDTMSDADEEVKFCVKVMINKEKSKVLFVEADNHFTDLLLSFLTLPLEQIVRVLKNHGGAKPPFVFGSLTSLHQGLSDLLRHTSPSSPTLSNALAITATTGASKTRAQASAALYGNDDGDGGLYTTNTASFIISDDLRIAPVVPGAVLQALTHVGITDTVGAELRMVTFGMAAVKDLLGATLLSDTPLSDIILRRSSKTSCVVGDLLHHMERELPSSESNTMILKAIIHKSTNKILIVEAEENFIDFLFSFLRMPLGGVISLLGGNTPLKNIDNLYKSVANVIGDKYLRTKDTKTMLLEPKLPNCSTSQHQIFLEGLSPYHQSLFPMRLGDYVEGQMMYNVTDDLTVTPFSVTSCISVLNDLKIPLLDAREVDLCVGVEEALSILKASLTSTSALTNGVMNSILRKQPKQEH